MSLIESMSEEDFKASTENVFAVEGVEGDESVAVASPSTNLVWCEFCKGNYDPEFHFGDREGV